jgi:hypothetical protein
MNKCFLCQQGKAKRFCPTLKQSICSLCCGSKRNNEITCSPFCQYLQKGAAYQETRNIHKLLSQSFVTPEEAELDKDLTEKIVMPLEEFFVDEFYDLEPINDDDIFEALTRLYFQLTGQTEPLTEPKPVTRLILEGFSGIDRATPEISREQKARSVLRMLKSIKNVSGGALGNRNYLELVYSMFYEDGEWSHFFDQPG